MATVTAGFPGWAPSLGERVAGIDASLEAGAGEIEAVLNRDAFLAGDERLVAEEITAFREVCGGSTLKVILEAGELGSPELIRGAAFLAMDVGADFLKTSTGKVGTGATPAAARCMMEAVRDFSDESGRRVGIKVAGGVHRFEQAFEYLQLQRNILGTDWLTPSLFRIGATSLLDDVAMRRGAR